MIDFSFDSVDWELFREQKTWLVVQNDKNSEGILNMMDTIQDAAFATGKYSEEQIYGKVSED
jgi:hypothetical protein